MDPTQEYNSTIISVNYSYNANGLAHSIFCNNKLFYNITVESSTVTVENAASSGVLTTVSSAGVNIHNTQLNNVKLISSSPSGLITGQAQG